MNCRYCNENPPIDNSHIVSKFLVKHIKRNSPGGYLLNSWLFKKQQDGIKGPYLCEQCDNVVFSDWEDYYKTQVLDRRNENLSKLSNEKSVKFVLSIAFRYSVHFIETSPIEINRENNIRFKDLSHQAINDLNVVGNEIFIYPFPFKPITESCKLIPGINHFLNIAFHAQSLPKEDGLPNAFLLTLPSMLFLITDDDLTLSPGNELINTMDLQVDTEGDWNTFNTNMPEFLYVLLNRYVGQSQADQRNKKLWNKISYGFDKLHNPNKLCYHCQGWDSNLLSWQQKNCVNKVLQRKNR